MSCNSNEIALGNYCVFISKPTAMSPWGKEPFVVKIRAAGSDHGVEITVGYNEAKETLSVKAKPCSLDGPKTK